MDAADIRRALEPGEFELHYRPRVALGDGAVCGLEAALRWPHPQAVAALPESLQSELAWQMVDDALSALRLWEGQGVAARVWLPLPRAARTARARMGDYAALHGIDGARLLCADAAPLLRIDAPTLEEAAESPAARARLADVLRSARAAGLAGSAAGVSTLLQWLLLAELGCAFAAGEFIAPRLPAQEVPAALRRWSGQHAAMTAAQRWC